MYLVPPMRATGPVNLIHLDPITLITAQPKIFSRFNTMEFLHQCFSNFSFSFGYRCLNTKHVRLPLRTANINAYVQDRLLVFRHVSLWKPQIRSCHFSNFMPLHVSITCAHHQEFKILYTASVIITLKQIFNLSQYLTNLMHKICFTISFISCLYMFRPHVLIIRRSKLKYNYSETNFVHQVG